MELRRQLRSQMEFGNEGRGMNGTNGVLPSTNYAEQKGTT
jgi:hypothetical protein